MVERYRLWVGGAERPGNGEEYVPHQEEAISKQYITDNRIPVEDPATGEIFAYCHSASPADVNETVNIAHKAYKSGIWSKASRKFRADTLDKIAELLQANLDILIPLEVHQTGRAVREMKAQVPSLVKWFKYYASLLRVDQRPVIPTTGKLHNWIERVPIGVVAQITPFNHPLLIATKKITPALAAGNSVVVKPSELTPITTLLLGKIFKDAGLPDGVFNVTPGYGFVTGKALVEHPLISKIDVTGSTNAGRAIGAIAGQKLNSFTAELGGKAPLIIFEDAETQMAVNGIAFGSFIASGQTCIAATRILVQNSIMDNVLPLLKRKCELILNRMGDPTNPKCSMGPLISSRQLSNVVKIVDEAVSEGVNVLCGGKRLTGKSSLDGQDFDKGYYFAPTVLYDGPNAKILHTRLWKEEAFGPAIVVVGFEDEEEAIRLANDSEFGLGAALWTTDLSQAFRVSDQIDSGIVWVNTHHRNDPSSPWGGMGSSGVGSENGLDAYYAYTKMKSIIINYASAEEILRADDWFGEGDGDVRYG